MFYRKNVGATERWLRFAAGMLVAGCGLVLFGTSALGLVLACAGLISAATGVFGFCPACAVAGRGLPAAPGASQHGEH